MKLIQSPLEGAIPTFLQYLKAYGPLSDIASVWTA